MVGDVSFLAVSCLRGKLAVKLLQDLLAAVAVTMGALDLLSDFAAVVGETLLLVVYGIAEGTESKGCCNRGWAIGDDVTVGEDKGFFSKDDDDTALAWTVP